VLFVSPICEQVMGYTADEFIADPNLFKSIIFPSDIDIWANRCKRIEETDQRKIQFRVIHKSGKTVWLEHNSQKIFGPDQKLVGYFS